MIALATQNGNVNFSFLGTMESPTITGGGGLSVLAVAGLAVSCFNRATQIASNTLHVSRAVISWITGEQLPDVIKATFIPKRLNNVIGAAGIILNGVALEIFKKNEALARRSLANYGALGLFIMCLTYIATKSRSNRQNCLDWTIRTALLGGIIIREVPSSAITPNEMMLYLRSHPSCIEVVQANSEVGNSNACLGSEK
jgi:hypothetical protein